MRTLYSLIERAGLTTVTTESAQYAWNLAGRTPVSDREMSAKITALWVNGYLSKIADGVYVPAK